MPLIQGRKRKAAEQSCSAVDDFDAARKRRKERENEVGKAARARALHMIKHRRHQKRAATTASENTDTDEDELISAKTNNFQQERIVLSFEARSELREREMRNEGVHPEIIEMTMDRLKRVVMEKKRGKRLESQRVTIEKYNGIINEALNGTKFSSSTLSSIFKAPESKEEIDAKTHKDRLLVKSSEMILGLAKPFNRVARNPVEPDTLYEWKNEDIVRNGFAKEMCINSMSERFPDDFKIANNAFGWEPLPGSGKAFLLHEVKDKKKGKSTRSFKSHGVALKRIVRRKPLDIRKQEAEHYAEPVQGSNERGQSGPPTASTPGYMRPTESSRKKEMPAPPKVRYQLSQAPAKTQAGGQKAPSEKTTKPKDTGGRPAPTTRPRPQPADPATTTRSHPRAPAPVPPAPAPVPPANRYKLTPSQRELKRNASRSESATNTAGRPGPKSGGKKNPLKPADTRKVGGSVAAAAAPSGIRKKSPTRKSAPRSRRP